MRAVWRPSEKRLYGKPCVELSLTMEGKKKGSERELCLVGKYGEIWKYSATKARLYIYSTRIRNKFNDGNAQLVFSSKDVDNWCKVLKVVRTRTTQAEIANDNDKDC